MKQILQILALLLTISTSWSQNILTQDFSNIVPGTLPTGWQVSNNTDVHSYFKPFNCQLETGLQTPGVGKDVPARMILPLVPYDADSGIIKIGFKVFVFDANLSCNSYKDFPCPTFVRVMLAKNSFTGNTNDLPVPEEIYAEQTYRIMNANGDNTIVFNHPPMADKTNYRLYLDFKTNEGSGCTGEGTKFVFDDFSIANVLCVSDCAPVANNDYFDGARQGFVNIIKGNVYGGFALWANESKPGFESRSLSYAPAVNGGLDYDVNNHNLSQMQFVLVTPPEIQSTYCASSTPGNLEWNADGTFQFTRTDFCVKRVSFTYKIIDPTALESSIATVTIDFPVYNPLPVQLSAFSAYRKKSDVNLKWTTLSEQNLRGFYIQRNTGEEWVNRAFIPSAAGDGFSINPLTYYYTDFNDYRVNTQYRLAQADVNGRIGYSEICLVMGEQDGNHLRVSAFPNPSATGYVNLLFANGEKFNLEIFDMHGRRVRQWNGIGGELLAVKGLEPGMYIIRVKEQQTGESDSLKITIIRK